MKSALWLSLYGFENIPGGRMDGAYHRSCIVSELHGYDRIFVARPLANAWTAGTARQLVRGPGLAMRDVVFGWLQGRG